MNKENEHLQDISEIRSLMEKSTTFISLSGLSGVVAGVCALLGAGVAYQRLNMAFSQRGIYDEATNELVLDITLATTTEFIMIAVAVLFSAIFFGIVLTMKKAKKNGQALWDKTSQRLLINMAIPLVAGGTFCLILLHHQFFVLVAPATLLFYGLALINASKYTLHDIRALGITEVVLGILSAYFIGNGLLFWTIGFGVMHIVYGTMMYFKYDK